MVTEHKPPKVFVSYSRADKPLARRIARRLTQAGASVFIDEERRADLASATSISGGLEKEISQASHVVVVWTDSAAASAKGDGWVARELTHANQSGVRVLPLLFFDPKAHPIVDDSLGVVFSPPHRFERCFAEALPLVFGASWNEPDADTLAHDFARTVRETPALESLFDDPVQRAGPSPRRMAEAFERWAHGRVSTAGLPTLGLPDYHALDYALWCAGRTTLMEGSGLHAHVYPTVFAQVLGATGAGYEALVELLDADPEVASRAMAELISPSAVLDPGLSAVVELYDHAWRLSIEHDNHHSRVPYSATSLFVNANRERLSEEQQLTLFHLVALGGDRPGPGGPLDLLGELVLEPRFRDSAIQRVAGWAEAGMFDRTDLVQRSLHPRYFYGFVQELFAAGITEEAKRLLTTVAEPRIKRLLRSGDSGRVVTGLQWVADAVRLSQEPRLTVGRAFRDGVYSVEFETWVHADEVGPAATALALSMERDEYIDAGVALELNRALERVGLRHVAT